MGLAYFVDWTFRSDGLLTFEDGEVRYLYLHFFSTRLV